MKVLHVNSYYQNNYFFKNLFDARGRAGDALRVFVPVAKGFRSDFCYGDYADLAEDLRSWDKPFFHLRYAKALSDAKARYAGEGWELIHAHSLFSNGYLAYKLHGELGVPYVVAVRDADVNVFFRLMPQLRPLARRILRGAARVVFLSEPYRSAALLPYLTIGEMREVLDKSVVLTNGVDRMWLENRAEPRKPSGDGIRLLSVGRIIARKNLPAAAEACRILNARGQRAKLTVVGRAEDAAVVRKLSAYDCVKVLPPRPMAELLPLYRESDIFLLPSRRETFGLVYAEAMTQALPVLYSRGQGFDGQFAEGAVGFSVKCDDPNEMAERALAIMDNYEDISARCAAECARFDWDRIARDYGELYREAVTGP